MEPYRHNFSFDHYFINSIANPSPNIQLAETTAHRTLASQHNRGHGNHSGRAGTHRDVRIAAAGRNRACDGDRVLVELLPVEQWVELSQPNVKRARISTVCPETGEVLHGMSHLVGREGRRIQGTAGRQ